MKTFTITEDQIIEGYNAACSEWKNKIIEWFPDVFNKKLEIGKIYKHTNFREGGFMFKFKGEFGQGVTYGFNSNGEWRDNLGIWEDFIDQYEEATEEEWLESLMKEAKCRGFKKGVGYKYPNKPYIETRMFQDMLRLSVEGYELLDEHFVIMRDGIWAEVHEDTPTQKEIDRVLNYLKIK